MDSFSFGPMMAGGAKRRQTRRDPRGDCELFGRRMRLGPIERFENGHALKMPKCSPDHRGSRIPLFSVHAVESTIVAPTRERALRGNCVVVDHPHRRQLMEGVALSCGGQAVQMFRIDNGDLTPYGEFSRPSHTLAYERVER